MFAASRQGFTSIQAALILPTFLTLVLFVFEFTKFFFVNIQLLQVLEQVTLESRIGGYSNAGFDAQARAVALASAFDVRMIDSGKIQVTAFWADTIADLAGGGATAGVGVAGQVVRHHLRYEHAFFGNFGVRAWDPINLEFVQVSRNEAW